MADWIEWKGGPCPCPEAMVDVRLRDGFTMRVPALDLMGEAIGEPSTPDNSNWLHDGGPDDLMAYRIVENPETNS